MIWKAAMTAALNWLVLDHRRSRNGSVFIVRRYCCFRVTESLSEGDEPFDSVLDGGGVLLVPSLSSLSCTCP
jgi:hypothetical protein